MDSNRFYVYIYLDPRKPGEYNYGEFEFDHEPFYVGKGRRDRYLLSYSRSDFCQNKIEKIRRELKKEPIVIKVKESLFEDDAFALEIQLIGAIGRKYIGEGVLCNHTCGGEGASGNMHTEETKAKLKDIHKNRLPELEKIRIEKIRKASTGRKHTDEAKLKIGKAHKGSTHTKETKAQMSVSAKNKPPVTEETRAKLRKIHGRTYTLIKDGVVIVIHNLKQFCVDNQLSYGCMRKVVSGVRPHHKSWTALTKEQSLRGASA